MKTKFNSDRDELERVRNHPNAVKITDPNDPAWDNFDFQALLDAVKVESPDSWAKIANMSHEQLRVILSQSGTIYKLPDEDVPKNC